MIGKADRLDLLHMWVLPNWTRRGIGSVILAPPVMAGDYNDNGTVDAADYTVWRDQLGQAIAMPNETVTPGMVTQEDYDEWKANFGNSSGSGTLSSATVPEPTTGVMLMLGIMATLSGRRTAVSNPIR
jgi:PEP-CTERM motif